MVSRGNLQELAERLRSDPRMGFAKTVEDLIVMPKGEDRTEIAGKAV